MKIWIFQKNIFENVIAFNEFKWLNLMVKFSALISLTHCIINQIFIQ